MASDDRPIPPVVPAGDRDVLPYAPARSRRRRWVRAAAAAVVVSTFVAAVLACGRPVARRLTVMRTQRAALAVTVPGDQLVLLEDEASGPFRGQTPEITALLAQPDFVPAYTSSSGRATVPFVIGRIRADVDGTLAAAGLGRTPTVYKRPGPLLFFGRLRSVAGDRLVAVSYHSNVYWDHMSDQGFELTADVYRPATLTQPMSVAACQFCDVGRWPGTGRRVVRLFAGQADPADPARFTIDYRFDGSAGTLVGSISPDGQTVDIHALDGPLKEPG